MIRDVTVQMSQVFTTWAKVKTAGAITLSNSDRTATIDNSDATRTYLTKSTSVVAGNWYYFSVFVDSAAANFDKDTGYGDAQVLIYEAANVQAGQQYYAITAADNGRRVGILYQSAITGTQSFRVGVGAVGNREAGTLVISDPNIYSYGTTQPAYVDKFYPVGAQTFPYLIQTSKAAASTYVAGVITEIAPATTSDDAILCTGDSYGMNQRYPYYLQLETGGIVYNRHVGGENLAEILLRLPGDLAGDFWPADMLELFSAPKTLILEGGGNSALENVDATVILGLLDDCIDVAVAAGVQRVIIVNLPPFLNYASYTQSKAYKALKYNQLLGSKYRGYPVYDLYNAVKGDVAAGDTFSASGASWTMHPLSKIAAGDTYDYDSGDGLHPSTAASEKIGEELALMLLSYTSGRRRSGMIKPLAFRLDSSLSRKL